MIVVIVIIAAIAAVVTIIVVMIVAATAAAVTAAMFTAVMATFVTAAMFTAVVIALAVAAAGADLLALGQAGVSEVVLTFLVQRAAPMRAFVRAGFLDVVGFHFLGLGHPGIARHHRSNDQCKGGKSRAKSESLEKFREFHGFSPPR